MRLLGGTWTKLVFCVRCKRMHAGISWNFFFSHRVVFTLSHFRDCHPIFYLACHHRALVWCSTHSHWWNIICILTIIYGPTQTENNSISSSTNSNNKKLLMYHFTWIERHWNICGPDFSVFFLRNINIFSRFMHFSLSTFVQKIYV